MYVLDTNTLIYFFRGSGRVAERMFYEAPADIGISAVVIFELLTGIAKSASPKKKTKQLNALLDAVKILPFSIGNAAGRSISYYPRLSSGNLVYGENRNWMMAFANKNTTFLKNGAYNLDGRVAMHFGYIVVSPALAVTVAGKGSDYVLAALDSNKKALDGSKTYKLHLSPHPPAKDFWAVTLYDTQTRSQLQTDQQFPTLGSQGKDLKKNADGSYDIYFSPKAPEGQENNWLQTNPEKSWWIVLRIYGPEQAWIDQTWRPGEIELAKKYKVVMGFGTDLLFDLKGRQQELNELVLRKKLFSSREIMIQATGNGGKIVGMSGKRYRNTL